MSELILYTTEDGSTRLDLRIEGETVWMSQSQMADLFRRSKKMISEHLGNIFVEGELQESSVVRNFRTTATDGKDYEVAHYNLEAVLAVGFRVKSLWGTQFWQSPPDEIGGLSSVTAHFCGAKPAPYRRRGRDGARGLWAPTERRPPSGFRPFLREGDSDKIRDRLP
jgi:hypothetical protein